MADNVTIPATGTGDATPKVATRSVTYSGDTAQLQVVALATIAGSDDAKTVTDVSSSAPLPVTALGDVANDGVDSGNPVKIGGRADTTVPTPVSADGDRVNAWFGPSGSLSVRIVANDETAFADEANPLTVQLVNESGVVVGGTTPVIINDNGGGLDVNVVTATGIDPVPAKSTSSVLSNVSASITSVTLKASTIGRLQLIIVNDSSASLYVALAASASATSYSYKLGPGGTLEMGSNSVIYTGAVSGIWDAAVGTARVTELT